MSNKTRFFKRAACKKCAIPGYVAMGIFKEDEIDSVCRKNCAEARRDTDEKVCTQSTDVYLHNV